MPTVSRTTTVSVGRARVTYLADGGGRAAPTALFPDTTEADWTGLAGSLDAEGDLVTSIGGFVARLGEAVVVIDAGIGPGTRAFPGLGTFEGGDFLTSLSEAGVGLEEVTDVVFTHLHVDHVGWVTRPSPEGPRLTFPNARHHVAAREWDFWSGKDDPAGPDPGRVQARLEGRIARVADGDAIAPGITVMATAGHTPGHLSVVIDGGDDVRVVVLGDVLFTPAQLEAPAWAAAFDVDPAAARRTRERLLPQLDHPGTLVAAGHFADRVFGRIARSDVRFTWRAYGR